MDLIEVNIDLDPVKDGMVGIEKPVNISDQLALIAGTNGNTRVVDKEEALSIIGRLGESCEFTTLGNTGLAVIYNRDRVMRVNDRKYLIGSAIIAWYREGHMYTLNTDEVEIERNEFISRLTILNGECVSMSAFEID